MSRENRSLESEGLLELTTPVSYQEVNGAGAKPASTLNFADLEGLAGLEIFQRIETARQLEPSSGDDMTLFSKALPKTYPPALCCLSAGDR